MQRIITASLTIAFLCLAVVWTGCVGHGKNVPAPDEKPDPSPEEPTGIPDWFLQIPDDPNYLYANATASATRDLGLALSAAKDAGAMDIAGQIATKVSGMFKRFLQEVGVAEDAEIAAQTTLVSKAIVAEVIRGCRPVKQGWSKEGLTYHAYVQMRMPVREMNTAVVRKVKANKDMYTRFTAAQAFKELEKEVEKYEDARKEQ